MIGREIKISARSARVVKQKVVEFMDGLLACKLERGAISLEHMYDRVQILVDGRKVWVVQIHGVKMKDGTTKQWVEEHHYGALPVIPKGHEMWMPIGTFYRDDRCER